MASTGHAHPLPFSTLDVHISGQTIELSVTAHAFDLAHDLSSTPAEGLNQPPEKYPGYRRENLGNVKGALQAIYDDLKK